MKATRGSIENALCEAMGKKALKEKPTVSKRTFTARIGVAMEPRLRKIIEMAAKRKGMTKSEVAREAIEAKLA